MFISLTVETYALPVLLAAFTEYDSSSHVVVLYILCNLVVIEN